jgi:hypothetical protein
MSEAELFQIAISVSPAAAAFLCSVAFMLLAKVTWSDDLEFAAPEAVETDSLGPPLIVRFD